MAHLLEHTKAFAVEEGRGLGAAGLKARHRLVRDELSLLRCRCLLRDAAGGGGGRADVVRDRAEPARDAHASTAEAHGGQAS